MSSLSSLGRGDAKDRAADVVRKCCVVHVFVSRRPITHITLDRRASWGVSLGGELRIVALYERGSGEPGEVEFTGGRVKI